MMARVNRIFQFVGSCLFLVSMLLPGANSAPFTGPGWPGYFCAGVSLSTMLSPTAYLSWAIGLPLGGWANVLVVESWFSASFKALRRARPFVAVAMAFCLFATRSFLRASLSKEEKDKLIPMVGFYVWGTGILVIAATEFGWWWLERRRDFELSAEA
ncbi:hypothetical protein AB4Y89_21260 [Terriglobus sp. 2YAB30_2]|uniref:hypothetical protein n=1 Tax=unclassified Terriglobus TaxID=2628988 RepID=UPI003F9DA001